MHIYSPQPCTAHMLLCVSGILNINADVMHAQASRLGKHHIERMKMQAQKRMSILNVGIYSVDAYRLSLQ